MGPVAVSSAGGGNGGVGRGDGCCYGCDNNDKCSCKLRLEQHHFYYHLLFSSGFGFIFGCFVLLGSIASVYAWLVFTPSVRTVLTSHGCLEDNEGSWSIGVFYGDSPLSLKPIEAMNVWRDESAAWPVANPVVTCASVSDTGFPSNFVANPSLFVQGDTLYLFYETKNSITMQGDIGVAKSIDKGVTWQQLGIALDEDWHLSYPYVFSYLDQIYMMPEGSKKGDLRLYRSVDFPLQWKLEKVIMRRPLVGTVIVNYDGKYWLFGSDRWGFGTKYNGQLEIWYSDSPFGPWTHNKKPIHNTDKCMGARNGGRPFLYNGNLYRISQDCGETYGRSVRVFKIEVLATEEYKEVEVPLGVLEPTKGRNAWNGARYHHLDVQQLPSGEWIGVMDGDRVPSGDSTRRLSLGYVSVALVLVLIVLLGVSLGFVNCIIPLNPGVHISGKRNVAFLTWERANSFPKLKRFCSRIKKIPSFLRYFIKANSCVGKVILGIIFSVGVGLMCTGVTYIYGGNGAEEPYPWKGHYSQFTLLTMTYDARIWNLKMYVKHYSRCSSVREIVIIWNKGTPPKLSDLDSVVPVRIRVEEKNSLNNRFNADSSIKTRAILELDDDIMMTCDDIERGFNVWRQHPEMIVGFYPRLIDGTPLKYRGEKYARKNKGYNMILTGAAFMDAQVAFQRYWGEEAKEGRELVDKLFNCEDVLLNYLYANASSSKTVEYVRPAWAIDTSKFSGAAISRNTNVHYKLRTDCLVKFSEMYGSLAGRKSEFNSRKDGWDV